MRLLVIILFLFWVSYSQAEDKPLDGKHFSSDEQLAVIIYIKRLQAQILEMAKERNDALHEKEKMFLRLRKQGQCV